MKRKIIGALVSALVFPGIGQYYLGRRKRALLFLLPAAVAGLVYVDLALQQATVLADQVLGGTMPLDPAAISAKLEAQPTPLPETLAGIVFVVCWVGSIAEALFSREA